MVVSPASLNGVGRSDIAFRAWEADHLCIRGRQLQWGELVDRRLFDAAVVQDLREQVRTARPFEHLIAEHWFNPTLLELVCEEFDLRIDSSWRVVKGRHESTRRSTPHSPFGPATQLYFSIVNSGWFLDLLSAISGVEDLIADPMLYGGGLHETRAGGAFGIHRDFDRHVRHGLSNQMVFITYLNKGWDPAWDGGLELWDAKATECIRTVQPDFGRSIMLKHGPTSYHGHPRPLSVPEGQVRRSVAAYYYTNPLARELREQRVTSSFLFADHVDGVRRAAKLITPPIVWIGLKKLLRRPVSPT